MNGVVVYLKNIENYCYVDKTKFRFVLFFDVLIKLFTLEKFKNYACDDDNFKFPILLAL